MAEETSSSWVGKTLAGRYLIERKLGAGAMGAVFVANQLSMDRKVALKLLHANLQGSENLARRFEREMKATSKVDHQNTVRVYDFGETEDGKLYLAMELVPGRSLRAAISEVGVFDTARALKIAIQIGKALNAAHSEGIVHRDLKPDNVMLMDRYGENDFVKVLDFGIARFVDEASTQLTNEGQVVGTPLYIAPEQARGTKVDHRADIYALGVMLYELVVGQVPFTSETLVGLLLMHAQEPPPPPSEVVPGRVPPHVEAVILQLLAKDPVDRPQSAADVVTLLEHTLATVGPGSAHHPQVGQPSPTVANPGRVPKGRGSTVGLGIAPVPGGLQTAVSAEPSPKKSNKGLVIGVLAALVVGGTIAGLAAAGVFSDSAPKDPGDPTATVASDTDTSDDDGAASPEDAATTAAVTEDAGSAATTSPPTPDAGVATASAKDVGAAQGAASDAKAVEDSSVATDTADGSDEAGADVPGDRKAAPPSKEDVAKLREALVAAQRRMGDPEAPARCQTQREDVLSVLVRVAGFLQKATLDANSTLDGLALQQLDSVVAQGAQSAEYWSFVALAKLSTKTDDALATAPLNAAQAVGLCGEWAVGHRLLGNTAFRAQDYPKAVAAYQRALALLPTYPKVRANLAFAHARAGQHGAAVKAASAVLSKQPRDVEMLDTRYNAQVQLKKLAAAEKDLALLVTLRPKNKDYWYNLGAVRAMQRKKALASNAFCQAKALGKVEAAQHCKAPQ